MSKEELMPIIIVVLSQLGYYIFQYINVYTSQLKNYYAVRGTAKEVAIYTTLSATVGNLALKLMMDVSYPVLIVVSLLTNLTASADAKKAVDKKKKKTASLDTYKIGGVARNQGIAEEILEELRELDIVFSVLEVEKKKSKTKRFEVYTQTKPESRAVVGIFEKYESKYDVVKLEAQSFR